MTVVVRGTVRTMDPARPLGRAVVVEGDRIVALDAQPAGAEVVDGGCVLPGFSDAHADLDGAQVLATMVGGSWTQRIP